MKIHKASLKDLPGILRLLETCKLPVQGVAENLKNFIVLKEGGRILGCVGLEIYDSVCLLRSLAVSEDVKRKGYGFLLVDKILHSVKKKNIKKIYLLTTDAVNYFKRFDFRIINRHEAYPKIQRTLQFTSLCCQAATCLVKTIK